MPTVDVYNMKREKVSEIDLDEAIFGAEVKDHLLYTVVRWQRAKARQGTHQAKNRVDVRGGGRKPWKQKGTGRARHGSTRSPIWTGGGVTHGPQSRSHAFKINKKVRAAALRSALSRRVQENALVVLDKLELTEIKTRQFVDLMKRFDLNDALFVLPEKNEVVWLSSRNLQKVTVLPSEGLNVQDILRRSSVVMTEDAVRAVSARLAR